MMGFWPWHHKYMQFNSLYFILFFLPAAVAGYYVLERKSSRMADAFLVLMSMLFYSAAGLWAFCLLCISVIVNYGISRVIVRGRGAKVWLTTGIMLNILLLAWYKYAGFFADQLPGVFRNDQVFTSLMLPLGISFYTITQISWLADCAAGKNRAVGPLDYALFVTFFPKLTQGPILDYGRFLASRRTGRPDAEAMARAVQMFVFGLFKKMVFADTFAKAVTWGFDQFDRISKGELLLVMLAYTFQIYFDFSGYSDMAIALGEMFGFSMPANFNSPYKAVSITDFWKRWHISLTTFLREYVYFPLGGSRKGTARTYLNIMIVYLISGIWHGAGWMFVLWGALNGLCQILERVFHTVLEKVPVWIRRCATFMVLCFLWIIFRCQDLEHLRVIIWHLTCDKGMWTEDQFLEQLKIPALRYALSMAGFNASDHTVYAASAAVMFALAFIICLVPENNQKRRYRQNVFSLGASVMMLIWCMLSMSQVSAFIYNHF